MRDCCGKKKKCPPGMPVPQAPCDTCPPLAPVQTSHSFGAVLSNNEAFESFTNTVGIGQAIITPSPNALGVLTQVTTGGSLPFGDSATVQIVSVQTAVVDLGTEDFCFCFDINVVQAQVDDIFFAGYNFFIRLAGSAGNIIDVAFDVSGSWSVFAQGRDIPVGQSEFQNVANFTPVIIGINTVQVCGTRTGPSTGVLTVVVNGVDSGLPPFNIQYFEGSANLLIGQNAISFTPGFGAVLDTELGSFCLQAGPDTV
jgi:hypothetical protein